MVQLRKVLVQAIDGVQVLASCAAFEFRLPDVSPDSSPIARDLSVAVSK